MEKILVLCDDLWHPAEIIEKGLETWNDKRYQFDIIKTAKDVLTPERIAKYRVIVCCKGNSVIAANNAPWFEEGVSEVMPRDFKDYIQAGGGFIAVHSTLTIHDKDFVDIVGSEFVTHPPRCTTELSIVKPEHPIAEGVTDFTIRDEHYCLEMSCEDADIFMNSWSEKGGTQPAGYTREIGDGRMCVLSPGHTLDVWENALFRKLLNNAMEWCLKER